MLKFIKLDIDIMNDSKIKVIRKMPDGDKLVIMWIWILCIAMKSNISGTLQIGDSVPFTDEMLAAEFDIKENIVKKAMVLFQKLKMIEKWDDGLYYVTNFEKHQELERIEQTKKQVKERVQRHREKKKLLISDGDLTRYNTVTGQLRNGDVTPPDRDIEKDIDKDCKEKTYKKESKTPVFKKPSIDELQKYCNERKNSIDPQSFYDYYESVGWKIGNKPMKDWKAAIRSWEKKETQNHTTKNSGFPIGYNLAENKKMPDAYRINYNEGY